MNDIRYYFEKARAERFTIGAFNAANIETLKAIVEASVELRSPVIIEASSGETEYFGARQLRYVVNAYKEDFDIPIFLNLDHSHSVQDSKKAVDVGFDLIHFDGSKLDYEENVRKTTEVVEFSHAKNLIVEGEIDHIQGSSADHRTESVEDIQKKGAYTSPEKARDFVDRTGVDTLASFVGNVHGVYDKPPVLDIDLLKRIKEAIPDTYLSLHGGSGISANYVQSAVAEGGIVKVNVNSEMRMAFKEALANALTGNDEIAVYKIMPPVIKAVKDVVMDKIQLFGSVNKI